MSNSPCALNGWLILDKPTGITSAQAVAVVKRLLKPAKIGHGGTLDPLASGILPLALGEATKTFDYVVAHEKEYRFTVQWGEARDTDDAEGQVTKTSDKRPVLAEIEAILARFSGTIQQRPPSYSAISTGGKRAYALARVGQEVELAERPVEVFSLTLDEAQPNSASFTVVCGKGTYVRALARDMGEALGCYGHITMLRRTRVGKFSENNAISLDELRKMGYTPTSTLPLLAIENVLDDIPAVLLDASQATRLRQGQTLALSARPPQGALRCHGPDSKLLAMGQGQGVMLKPVRVFNL